MKPHSRAFAAFTAAWLVAPSLAAAQQGTGRAPPPDPVRTPPILSVPRPQRIGLDNGLDVLLLRDDRAPYFHALLQIPDDGPSKQEETPGIAALTRELIARGPSGLGPGATEWLLDSLGLVLETGGGGAQGAGLTAEFRLSGPAPGMDRGLLLLGEMVRDPALRTADLERIRDQMAARERRRSAEPPEIAMQRVLELLGAGRRAPSAPPPEGLSAIVADEVRRHHRTRVTPSGAVLVLVAPGDPAAAIQLVRRAFGAWSAPQPAPGPHAANEDVAAAPEARTERIVREGAAQAVLAIGYRTAGPGDPDHPVAALLRLLLGVRLHEALTGQGWSYGVQVPMLSRPGSAVVVIRAGVHPERRADAHELILSHIRSLREAPVSDDELLDIKHRLIAARTRLSEQRGWVAAQLATEQLLGPGDGYWAAFNASVVALTPDDVLQAAWRYLDPGGLVTVVVDDDRPPAPSDPTPHPRARLQP